MAARHKLFLNDQKLSNIYQKNVEGEKNISQKVMLLKIGSRLKYFLNCFLREKLGSKITKFAKI
jgi:hypothetical protein